MTEYIKTIHELEPLAAGPRYAMIEWRTGTRLYATLSVVNGTPTIEIAPPSRLPNLAVQFAEMVVKREAIKAGQS